MALSTSESPVYGGGTLVIDFPEDTPLQEGRSYSLVYEGSKQKHLTSARKITPTQLHSIIPGHNEEEDVKLNIVEFYEDKTTVLASHTFHYKTDSVFYLSQFLIESVFCNDALDDLELIKSDNFNLADEELSTLDKRLSRALIFCSFPEWWSLLGPDVQNDNPAPRETLLHFSARLNLSKVAGFFLRKPGSEQCLKLPNKNGQVPKDVALKNGHDGLAELLSEYNIHSLVPLSRWLVTEDGVIQSQDTGDVTLTCSTETHRRTIEEDIIVLQGVQKQIHSDDISRQWQTDWPSQTHSSSLTSDSDINNDDDKFKTICEKVQELPNVLTLESINSNRDPNQDIDPNTDSAPTSDHVDISEDCDVAMDTEPMSRLHVSEGEEEVEGIMDGTVSALRGYNEHLLRIRQKSTVFNKILEQDIRAENLARFSSSCPSLDVDSCNSPLPVIDEGDLCKSMVDLLDDNGGEAVTTPSSMYAGDVFSSGPDISDSSDNIHVVVDGATTDSSTDFGLRSQEYDKFLKHYYGGNIPQVRQRSPVRTERNILGESDSDSSMLIHGNKSVAMTTGDDADSTLCNIDDDAGDDGEIKRRPVRSTSDMEQDVRDEGIPKNSVLGSGRGQANNRYSADIEYMMRNLKGHHSGSSLDKMTSSTHSTGSGTDSDTVPHGKIYKALSMSSIPAATNNDKPKGSSYKDKHALFRRQDGIQEEDGYNVYTENICNKQQPKAKPQLSLLDFLNDSSNFSNDPSSPKHKEKEDKKRKPSVFSRFHSSYRVKKNKDKEGKSKSSTHRFVSVSFSNATTCDVCHKPLTNKPALRCQICLVNVHEHSCKEHIPACDKLRPKSQVGKQSSQESELGNQDRNGVSNLRSSLSFKDNSTRGQSVYGGAATQPVPITAIQPEIQQLQTASAQLQRRSLPTPRIVIDSSHAEVRPKSPMARLLTSSSSSSSSPTLSTLAKDAKNNQAIVEEGREQDNVSRLDLGQSNITEAISQSIESLDEVDSVQEIRYDDVVLNSLDTTEPETWSETVDRKVIKKLSPKDIKRQETIYELIQTERQYCKRLKTLEIYFRDGMLRELQIDRFWVDRLLPKLDDLIQIHLNFYYQLQELQRRRHDHLVEEIGTILKEQFSGESADQMKASYGAFCSGHLESIQLYKELMEKKKFQQFIRDRNKHPLCRKREIPDFILLITQRPTKYPTLIEAVIKSTKDKKERENLLKALTLSKDILQDVDAQVAKAERAMKLKDIYSRMDNRSFAAYRGKKFKKSDLVANNRVLLHEGVVGWRNARGKSVEVIAVVLRDVLIFLQENNQKYSFFSLDNKYGVVSLFNLLVREKCDTRDTVGLYLISQNKQNPEMYEIVFNTSNEMKNWAQILRAAVENCPEEEEEVPTEAEEERKRMEERQARAQTIMEKLYQKDMEIKQCCDAKNRLMLELLAVYNDSDDQPQQSNSRPCSREIEENSVENAGRLQAALQEVSLAASQLTTMLQGNGSNLSRSVSSVGEHTSNTYAAVPIPKRADTFGGFDSHDLNRVKLKGSDEPDFSADGDQASLYKESDSSDLDLTQYSEMGGQKNYDSEGESGIGSSFYSSTTSGSTLSPMSTSTHDQSNIARLLRTLNEIVHLTSSQGTAVETLRAQLAEANERINKLSVDVHEKKSGYRHSQLEELRNLQGVIQKEKEEWELKKTREKRDMEQERLQLEEMKRNLEKHEADIKLQKEELNKKREMLQKQMDLLRQSGQLPKDTSFTDLESGDHNTSVQSKSDFVPGHRRSASEESFNSSNGETNRTGPSASSKENNFRENKSVTKLQSFSFGSKQSVPVHLLSATNEQKMGSKNVQQLPSKLLASGSVSISPQQTTQSGHKNSSPGNLSTSHNNQSTQSLPQEYGVQGNNPNISHSSSAGHIVNTGSSQGQPVGASASGKQWQSNRPKHSSKSGGLSGLMKLSEKGDKKSKSSGSTSHSGDKGTRSSPTQSESTQQRPHSGSAGDRNPSANHKSQKSDSGVIYF